MPKLRDWRYKKIENLWSNSYKTLSEIAKDTQCSRQTVRFHLRRSKVIRICKKPGCNEEVPKSSRHYIHCSGECKYELEKETFRERKRRRREERREERREGRIKEVNINDSSIIFKSFITSFYLIFIEFNDFKAR